MNTQLKAEIEKAIQTVIDDNCDEGYWTQFIHPELVQQMTNALEVVFDAAMKSQEFFESETRYEK